MSSDNTKADIFPARSFGPNPARRRHSHPDKTYIGRTERDFDFLSNDFSPESLTLAKKTIERFVERAIRLYEQEPGEACATSRFGSYLRRWVRWTGAGLSEVRNAPTKLSAIRAP